MALLLVTACHAVGTKAKNTLGGQIEFQASGGIAGMRQTLTIDDAGIAVARDERRHREKRTQLPATRLVEIKAAFSKIDPKQRDGAASRPQCADCYEYKVIATIDGTHYEGAADTQTLATSPYRDAIPPLLRLLRETLESNAYDVLE